MNPLKISTLWQLQMAVKSKKAVIVPKSHCWARPIPAAFVIHQQGATLIQLFDLGMYIYKKPIKGEMKWQKKWQYRRQKQGYQ